MKITKAFLKIDNNQQLDYILVKYKEANEEVDNLKRMMASLRGGRRFEADIERPDEALLKSKDEKD